MMTPTPHSILIGALIRDARILRDLSHAELSRITGMDPSNLSNIENGKQNITIETLVKICTALRCVVDVSIVPAP
jgi:UDP-N-acetylglucosamine 1-carboxyvinyltransferase